MKRLMTSTLIAGLCLGMVLPGCVSSRKYKESQSSLNMSRQTVEQLRSDSAKLAAEATSMNEKITTLESERTSMKSSLDSLNNYITQQRPNMDYQAYFTGREQTGTQMQQSLTSSLSAVGLNSGDIEHQYGTVAVSIDEAKYFSGVNLNSSGRKVIKEIASAIKDQSDYKVGVSPMSPFGTSDSSNMAMDGTGDADMSSSGNATASGNTSETGTGSRVNSNVPDNTRNTASARKTSTVRKNTTARKTSTKRYSSESGRTVSNKIRPRKSTATPMSIRTQRATNVAKSLLQNGVDEVNVTLKNTKTASGAMKQKESIRVVLSPDNSKMFNQTSNPQANRTTSGQE